jgi:tetratricopeptide (TPR) repeat protein
LLTRSPVRYLLLLLSISLAAVFCVAGAAAENKSSSATAGLKYRPEDPLNATAFDHFYNMDYDRSVQEFEQILARHPDDPFAVNHLLTAVLFRELNRMGALNTGAYASDSFLVTPPHPADPKVQQQIKALVDRATRLEEKSLSANPNDVDALYARGVTRGEFSAYTALMERAWFSALRNAMGARRDHERVLELSPGYTDAKLIVGAHNYVIGSLPWGVKTAVSVVARGNKETGFQLLEEAANGNGESSIDAKILLVLFLRREHRYGQALQIAGGLTVSYPQDLLMALEEGNLLRAMGRNAEAAVVFRKIWQAGKQGGYPGLPYETAALSLGDLLRSQKDYAGALAAYEQVSEVPKPDPDILQKANLGAGEIYDMEQKRDQALKKYQAVVATNGGTPTAEIARKHMKDAYRAD